MFIEAQVGRLFVKVCHCRKGEWQGAPLKDRILIGWDGDEKVSWIYRSKFWR